jgi:tetratricopeptide (TPR) repeat protein
VHALLALSLALSTAIADDPEFTEGVRLYNEFEFEQSIFRFQKAALTAQTGTAGDRAEVFIWLGLSYAGIGDFESARRHFKDALSLAPDMPLPGKASPKVQELLEEVRADVKANPPPPPDPGPGPTSDPTADPPPPSGPPLDPVILWTGAGIAGALAVGALVGAGVMLVLMQGNLAIVQDENSFQDEAKAAQDAANIQAGAAVGLGVTGLVLGAAGAGLAVFAVVE